MKKTPLWMGLAALLLAAVIVCWMILAGYFVYQDITLYENPGKGTGYSVRFGTIEMDAEGHGFLAKETNVIPMRLKDTGFRFGMEIVPPDDQPYIYHSVFHFSAAPKVVGGDSFAGQAPSATMQTNEVSVSGEKIVDVNWFDPGDPMGEESIDVFINGKQVKTITFTVVPDD